MIVRDLLVEPRRFGELLITLGGVSPKVLTERLRSLEAHGILTRTVYPVMPLRVEYALTDLGRELRPVIDALAAWGGQLPAGAGGPGGAQVTAKPNRRSSGDPTGRSARRPVRVP